MNKKDCVKLDGLSRRQQKLVERHLPLVGVTLKRMDEAAPEASRGEVRELMQEGSLALVDAVRCHDPMRHGAFSAYAVSRMRFAMSRYVHESRALVRVPFITQRRRKKARRAGDRHDPGALPRVYVTAEPCARSRLRLRPRSELRAGELTIGDVIRERYERAMEAAAARMKGAEGVSAQTREVIDRCMRDRWGVPEWAMRTPIRQVAETVPCSLGRVTRCEERFRRVMMEILECDPVFQRLLELGRASAEGWERRLSEENLADLLERCREPGGATDRISEREPNAELREPGPSPSSPG